MRAFRKVTILKVRCTFAFAFSEESLSKVCCALYIHSLWSLDAPYLSWIVKRVWIPFFFPQELARKVQGLQAVSLMKHSPTPTFLDVDYKFNFIF